MLPSENRILSNYDYRRIYYLSNKYNQVIRTKFFDLRYIFNPESDENIKFGIVVPSKVFRTAVLRNKVKRVFRSIIRDNVDLGNQKGYKMVIYPKSNCLEYKYAEISTEFAKVLQKIFISR